jgi:serine/threonine-protein kinase RsbW
VAQVTQLAPDSAATGKEDIVVLVVPADGSYLAVLRTATAGLAARLSFTLDEIEDLRIAVDEACAMLLALAGHPPGRSADLTCSFQVTQESLSIEVALPVQDNTVLPSGRSFSWQVLTALAGEVTAESGAGRAAIRLTKRPAPLTG